jgi:hypothetical protein
MSHATCCKPTTPGAQGVVPTEDDARGVGELAGHVGEARAAAHLKCDRHTLARIAARFSVREGTLVLVRQRLAEPVEGAA